MDKIWSGKAWDDYLYWQKRDKKTFDKINKLIIMSGSFSEQLKDPHVNAGIKMTQTPDFLSRLRQRRVNCSLRSRNKSV